jgi:outer membrane protein assembly factor BamA
MALVGGYYRPNVGPGTSGAVISAERIYSPQQAPGIDRQTDFWRGGALIQADYRDNPYGPRSGGQYYARFDYYRDRRNIGHDFRRLTAEVQQFLPLFNKKRVIAARVRSLMSFENPNQRVPFYLQPSLGGWDDLRGFRPFRFYDNNSLAATAEWRWEVASGVDAALFVDAGKVAPRPGLLNFRGIEKSYGGGFRFRAPVSGAVFARLDAAVSRESVTVALIFSDIFAAPAIRTGRELSPPPGRLP